MKVVIANSALPSSAVYLYNYAAISFEDLRIAKQGRRPLELIIRLRPAVPPRTMAKSAEVFGFSFIPDGGGLGTYADVYVGGAAILARGFKSLEPLMLGHLVAHEIGHLLLGTSAHSVRGLMRSPWVLWRRTAPPKVVCSFLTRPLPQRAAR